MENWMLAKLSDYWDFNVRALPAGAARLDQHPESAWPSERRALEDALAEQVRVLPDEQLRRGAVSFADDLYKEACALAEWGGALPVYLSACAGNISRLLGERGVRIRYLIDNEFDDPTRPLQLFPEWFSYSGFVYACPQLVVMKLAERDGVAEGTGFDDLCRRYVREARVVIDKLVERALAEGRHIAQLDIDSVDGSYNVAMAATRDAGAVTVLRSEAPEPGSRVDVWIADETGRDTDEA